MNMPILAQTIQVADKQTSLIQYKSVPVMATAQLAEFYGAQPKNINDNFSNNIDRFEEDKHFFKLEGDELKAFKNITDNIGYVPKQAARLILWTEKGAARHAKILDTDQAWDVFEQLEEVYFAVKEKSYLSTLPNFADPAEAAIAWANEYKAKQLAEQQLQIAAPKVQYFDRVADVGNLMTASTVGKKLGMSAQVLNEHLKPLKVYDLRQAGKIFAQWFIDKGFGEVKKTSNGYNTSKFTNKGEQWIVEKLTSGGVI